MKTSPRVAVAHRRKDPRKVDVGTTAGKQDVVVELVLLGRGTAERRALDREDDGRVVSGAEHEAAEPVLVAVPAKGEALPRTKCSEEIAVVCFTTTHGVDVPRGIEFVPVVLAGKLVGIGSHPAELGEGLPVRDIGTKNLGRDPLYGLALSLVDGAPASMLECLVRGWSVHSRRDCFER